jgi:DNA-binding transcriptional MerR regulator
MSEKEQHLSPAEAARRLGLSPKALRLYEEHGLVAPVRAANGWRAYGSKEIAILHQVMALKRLGLPLSRITDLLKQRPVSLETLLAVQERALAREEARVEHALTLVRAARATLASGKPLSVDDLITLTKETTMTANAQDDDMKPIFEPLIEKHFAPETRAELAQRPFDQEAITRQWNDLFAEAKAAMAKGDPASPEALALARRWKALVEQFTGGSPVLEQGARNVWTDAMADKNSAAKLPASPELFAFMGKAMAKLAESA